MSDVWKSRDKAISARHPLFVCTISYTATSENPGLTIAGAQPELVKFTPAADAEFLYYGHCKCIPSVPATPDGKPTPALITRAVLRLSRIPFLIIDAGAMIKPQVPRISFDLEPGGNIAVQDAMTSDQVMQALEYGNAFGSQIAKTCDLLVLGESIPGGTTTALAVLSALGVDARFRVSSSMPNNPHDKKNEVLAKAITRSGKPRPSAVQALAAYGDPMIASLAGMVQGATASQTHVMLAGGTQMAAVLAVLKALKSSVSNVSIATTTYVLNDKSADLKGLIEDIDPEIQILASNLQLDRSSKPGLQAFSQGFVKEGVGAGGCSVAAMLKDSALDGAEIMRATEEQYEKHIEAPLGKK